jgi:4-amino-4-deoxy-L-arabinose transferase-like glycosyltransferase
VAGVINIFMQDHRASVQPRKITSSAGAIQFDLIASILALTAAGFLLRCYGLGTQALWMDEVASLGNAAAFGSGGLAALAAADHVAPLHSILLWLVTLVGGSGETVVRVPSAIFGAAVIPVFAWVVFDMFRDARLTVAASLLMCCSPYAIWYSQEARMYSLLLLLSVVFVGLSWWASKQPARAMHWIALAGITALGLYTHHFMALIVCAFGVYLLGRFGLRSTQFWYWATSQALSLSLFLYWIYLTSNKLGAAAGVPKPAFVLWIPYTLFSFTFGRTLGPSVAEIHEAGIGSLLSLQSVWVGLAVICAAYLIYRGIGEILRSERQQAGLWCIVWIVVPIFLAILATQVTNISYNPRYIIVSLSPLIIVLAAGVLSVLRSGGPAVSSVIGLAAFIMVALGNLYWNPAYAREDVRPLARMLATEFQPSDIMVMDNSRIWPVLLHYGAPTPTRILQIGSGRTPVSDSLHTADAEIQHLITDPGARIWLVQYRSWETDRQRVLQAILDKFGPATDVKSWPGVSLRIYRLSASPDRPLDARPHPQSE